MAHSITKLHTIYKDNMSLVSIIFKSFTNHTPRLHFRTKKLTRFLTQKNQDTYPARITLTDLKSHQANQPEAQEHPNLMVVVPSQPYKCSSSYSQAKMPPRSTKIFKTRVAAVYCRERKSFPEKNDKVSCSKTHIRTSARENTTYIVWFK